MAVIALLTDFGLADHYAGTMKGVILSHAPTARIIDISHEVRPHAIGEAAYLLWASYRYFPSGTIFVCVVDPGVGSRRRIVCVKVPRFIFLAPENGVLDLVLSEERIEEAVEVQRRGSMIVGLPNVQSAGESYTFHGRDLFAPVAAAFAQGHRWNEEARRIELPVPPAQFVDSPTAKTPARILHVDRFGNLITNIRLGRETIKGLRVGRRIVNLWISHYAEAPTAKPCLIMGSSGLVEVVVREQSAQRFLHASPDTPVRMIVR